MMSEKEVAGRSHHSFSFFLCNIGTSIISGRHDKKESHDRAVEDKKSVGGCQQKEVQTYVDTYHE